jgi:hypothetical protein
VDAVWRAYTTPGRWASWSPQVRTVRGLPLDRTVQPGDRGEVVGPAGVRVAVVVTDVDGAARRWSWRVRVGALTLQGDHGVDAAGPRGCCAWMRLRGPLPVVVGYAPLARLALGRLVRTEESP